ncbi:MAG: P-loop NTPase [Myxococcota bacterium]
MNEKDAPIIGFLSGKGGVGKTNVATNVAVACATRGARVLVVDGDLGLANVDTLLGLAPRNTSRELLSGHCAFEEAIVEGPRGIHVLPAGQGTRRLSDCRPHQLAPLLVPLFAATRRYDLVLIDIGAGVGETALGLAACCDLAVLVTTPEPTSLVDAYATLKALAQEAQLPVEILVNASRSEGDARRTHDHLEKIAKRFLDLSPAFLGHVPSDDRLAEAVRLQRAVVESFPTAKSSRTLVRVAERLLRTSPRQPRVLRETSSV